MDHKHDLENTFVHVFELMNNDISEWNNFKKKFAVGHIIPRSIFQNDREFMLENGMILDRPESNCWTKEYLQECIFSSYAIILSYVIDELRVIKNEIYGQLSIDEKSALKFIKRKQRLNENLKSEHRVYGVALDNYIALGIRNLTNEKLKIIEELNSSGSLHIEDQISPSAEYPFFPIYTGQFLEFELCLRLSQLLPILRRQISNQNKNASSKYSEPNSSDLANNIHQYPYQPRNRHLFSNYNDINGEDFLFTLLLKANAIKKVGNLYTKNKRFRGVCACLYDSLSLPRIQILQDISKREFIEYLNQNPGYDAQIKNPQNSIIAHEGSKEKALKFISPILSDYFPNYSG